MKIMAIVVGLILATFGIVGVIEMSNYISNDWFYTYTSPLTNHEMTMIAFLVIFAIVAAVGIFVILFTVIKKRNSDTLRRLENMQEGGKTLGVCPSCGLNVTVETKVCPRCGTTIHRKEEM
mgnify:CR=1 FL=1